LLKALLISKAICSANMHLIKRVIGNCDTPRQYLNFSQTDFLYSSVFSFTWSRELCKCVVCLCLALYYCAMYGKSYGADALPQVDGKHLRKS